MKFFRNIKKKILNYLKSISIFKFLNFTNFKNKRCSKNSEISKIYIPIHKNFCKRFNVIFSFNFLELAVVEPIAEMTEKGETASVSFSTENTSSWLREHNMDADIHSYARARLLRQDEYFFRIWHYAKKLFE